MEGISDVSIRKKMKATLWLAVFWVERNVRQFEAAAWGVAACVTLARAAAKEIE